MISESDKKSLIEHLISNGYLKSEKIISVFKKIDRQKFIPESKIRSAYVDHPVSIGFGQTISAPHMVAIMTELLDVKKNSKILEVGSGRGYQTAILSELAINGKITTIEKIPELAEIAKKNFSDLGYTNIHVVDGDGSVGYNENSPYDRIIVTAGAPHIPNSLKEQLNEGGLMLIPVGSRWHQKLIQIKKIPPGFLEIDCGGCVFVPLKGKEGWE